MLRRSSSVLRYRYHPPHREMHGTLVISMVFARLTAVLLTAGTLVLTLACRSNEADEIHGDHVAVSPDPGSSTPQTGIQAAGKLLQVVERNKVCMVNNQYMGREQIPIVVEGKTYFGCCPMCKDKLRDDPHGRTARDPLTGKSVDKALAVIAKTTSSAVLYFENEQNLERYAAR